MKLLDFLHVDTNLCKLSLSKNLWVGIVKSRCGQSGQETHVQAVSERVL